MRTSILLTTTSLLAALALAVPGCQTTTVGPGGMVVNPPQPMPSQSVPVAGPIREGHGLSVHPAAKANEPDPADPCATRLEDIVTLLYEYYAPRHSLPEKLEDLGADDVTTVRNFTCPVSGKPYIYNPVGLQAPRGDTLHQINPDATAVLHRVRIDAPEGDNFHLILYDATPAHNGRSKDLHTPPPPVRWGVVAGLVPNKKGLAFYQMVVVQIPEAVFKTFVQAKAPLPPLPEDAPADPPISDQGAGTPPGQP
jgi:hypothetical protein